MSRRYLLAVGLIGLALAGMQAAAPARTNPPVDRSVALGEAGAPGPVLEMLHRACYDCHSDETDWPWYASVPPTSWLVATDVKRARGQLNFSRWTRYNPYDRADLLDKMCDMVSKRAMPLWSYRLAHAPARLSDVDIAALCRWTHAEAERVAKSGV